MFKTVKDYLLDKVDDRLRMLQNVKKLSRLTSIRSM